MFLILRIGISRSRAAEALAPYVLVEVLGSIPCLRIVMPVANWTITCEMPSGLPAPPLEAGNDVEVLVTAQNR